MPVLEQPVTVTIDHLLLATDLSRAAEKALAYASAIAQRFDSTIDLACVLDPSVVSTYEDAVLGLPLANRKTRFEEQMRSLTHCLSQHGIESHAHLPQGHDPAEALLKLAHERKTQLIVAATQSKRGVERILLGSTAEQLIRCAACPVLTVGPSVPQPPAGPLVFRNIVFATDLSPQSAKALPYALAFAEDAGAHLHLSMVIQDESISPHQKDLLATAFREGMKSMIPHRAFDWCTPNCLVEYGEAASTLLSIADRVDADLIVLGSRQASFWLLHVNHGLTPSLIAQAKCPVMTIC